MKARIATLGPRGWKPRALGAGQVRTSHIRGYRIVPIPHRSSRFVCWARLILHITSGVPACAAIRALGAYLQVAPFMRMKL